MIPSLDAVREKRLTVYQRGLVIDSQPFERTYHVCTVYQRGLVIDSQRNDPLDASVDSVSKGIGD